MSLFDFLQTHPLSWVAVMGIVGLIAGSFLNVVIYRLPRMMRQDWESECRELLKMPAGEAACFSLWSPPSHCPHCNHRVRPLENVPLISYLLLGGRCSACRERISWRYPVVELLTGTLVAHAAWYFGFGWAALLATVFCCALIALSAIDLEHKLLPDTITLPVMWLGLFAGLQGTFVELETSLWGAIIGYLSLWAIYWLFFLATGKKGFGYGDFKMLAMIGTWLGWQKLLPVVMFASLAGALAGISLIVLCRHDRKQAMPFGPWLAASGWFCLYYGELFDPLVGFG